MEKTWKKHGKNMEKNTDIILLLLYTKMPLYICELCNFNSKLKGDYNRHLKTKKHRNNCVSTNENSKDLMGMSQKEPQKTHNCDYCNESFSTIANKRRHELHRCKNNSNVSKSIIMKQEHKIKKLEKQMEELMKQIEVLLTKVGNTTINNTQNNNIMAMRI